MAMIGDILEGVKRRKTMAKGDYLFARVFCDKREFWRARSSLISLIRLADVRKDPESEVEVRHSLVSCGNGDRTRLMSQNSG